MCFDPNSCYMINTWFVRCGNNHIKLHSRLPKAYGAWFYLFIIKEHSLFYKEASMGETAHREAFSFKLPSLPLPSEKLKGNLHSVFRGKVTIQRPCNSIRCSNHRAVGNTARSTTLPAISITVHRYRTWRFLSAVEFHTFVVAGIKLPWDLEFYFSMLEQRREGRRRTVPPQRHNGWGLLQWERTLQK